MKVVEAKRTSGRWLESAWWDGVFLMNALWLAPLLALAWMAGRADAACAAFLKLGAVLLWGGHLLSPVVAAWRSPRLRASMREDPGRWIYRPLAVLAAGVALGLLGLTRSGATGAYTLLLVVFVVWNTWHFAGQHFGVLSIYRRIVGAHDDGARRADRAYTVLCTCVLLPVAWYLQSERIGPFFRRAASRRRAEDAGATVRVD